MNKKYLLASLFVTSLGTTSIAVAGAGDAYTGFSLGNVSQGLSGGFKIDDTIGWKIFSGYAFTDFLAIEGAYVSFGDADWKVSGSALPPRVSTSLETTGFEISAFADIPISSRFSFFSKVGLLIWDSEISISRPDSFFLNSNTGTDIFYGLGGQYEISSNLTVRASWERYTMDVDFSDLDIDIKIDFLSASMVFGF